MEEPFVRPRSLFRISKVFCVAAENNVKDFREEWVAFFQISGAAVGIQQENAQ